LFELKTSSCSCQNNLKKKHETMSAQHCFENVQRVIALELTNACGIADFRTKIQNSTPPKSIRCMAW
jgi:hypothetical protein